MEALGSAAYARLRASEQPELQDLVAAAVESRKESEAGEGGVGTSGGGKGGQGRAPKRQRVYEEHRPMSEVVAGIKAGRYHQGTLRCGAVTLAGGGLPACGDLGLLLLAPAAHASLLAPADARTHPLGPPRLYATPPCPTPLSTSTPHPESTASTLSRAGWAASRWGRTSCSAGAWT